jgi:PAS domain S-box-containing protein
LSDRKRRFRALIAFAPGLAAGFPLNPFRGLPLDRRARRFSFSRWAGFAWVALSRMKQRVTSAFSARLDRPAWRTYGFAALLLVAAQGVRWLLDPYTRDAVPLATMYIAVIFAVWYGGWKPAAVLALAGYFAGMWLFVAPRYTPKLFGDFGPIRGVLYGVSCAIAIYLCESLRRTRIRHAASEAKFVSILENMRECFCSVGRDWKIHALNRSAEAALGKTRDRVIGQPFWDVLPGCAGTQLETELRRAMREGAAVSLETNAFVHGAWHAVNATHVNDELAIFFQDITANRAHVDQLERLVDDRTAALQRIVADLEAFSYTLVHDMRAPLRSITGFAELLAADHAAHLDTEGKRHLSRIQRSAATMDRLITDILSYSQLSRNQPQLRIVNLDETIREILHAHGEFHPDKADIEIENKLPAVRGNDALLNQCFSNLLHNAAKFVPPGIKPRIRISSRLHGDVARIEIADNGIGIAPEATARIFEPFRREHSHYDGTGIGLAIVQKVVDQLEGRVGVESGIGQGSRFWVELKSPVSPASASIDHSPAPVRA